MGKRRKKASKRSSLQVVTLCISTALVLILVGLVVLSVLSARNLSKVVKENLTVTLVLSEEITEPEVAQMKKSLEGKRYVQHVKYISTEQVLAEETKALGYDPTEFVGVNFYTASLELNLKSDYANRDSMKWIGAELKKHQKVKEVDFQQDLMDQVNDNIGKEDIYISHWKDSTWSKAKPLQDLCTADKNEAPLALSADGTKMILFINGNLFLSTKNAEGWTTPQKMSDKINISEWQADAMITSDGKALLFAAKKQGEYEDAMSINIFVSLMDEQGEWSEPIDLGPTINTGSTDRSPFLHPDMKTLYFSTNGRPTVGSLDVYMSTRLRDDSWTEWSEPVSLGDEINTVGADCWYKISTDGTLAYFAQEGSSDMYDLYSVLLPEHLRPTPVATISGKLTDSKGKPVATVMRWENLETQEQVGVSQTDPTDGSFFIVLPEGKNYGYYIDDTTHFPIANNIDLRDKHEAVHIENNITVTSFEQMIEEQIPMPLNNLFFATNRKRYWNGW